jgi:excisionase family DNA binding protein
VNHVGGARRLSPIFGRDVYLTSSSPLKPSLAMPNERLYKIAEVAERLSVAPNTVRNAIESGHLFAYLLPGKGRGTYRVPESAIDAYLSRHVYRPPQAPRPKAAHGRPFKHLVLDEDR